MKLQMRISGAAEGLLNEMTERLDVTPKEVVLDALAVYYFAIEQVSQGRQVGSYDPEAKEFTGIATPSLQSFASRVNKEYLSTAG